MRIKVLRMLVVGRAYANTERGERTIVATLTIMSIVMVLDVVLLIVG